MVAEVAGRKLLVISKSPRQVDGDFYFVCSIYDRGITLAAEQTNYEQ